MLKIVLLVKTCSRLASHRETPTAREEFRFSPYYRDNKASPCMDDLLRSVTRVFHARSNFLRVSGEKVDISE